MCIALPVDEPKLKKSADPMEFTGT